MRRLALGVVGDSGFAEDALQEAYLAWLDGGEAPLANPRAWFAETCRRIGANRRRAERNRDHREQVAAVPEHGHSAAEVNGRLEVARRLLDELEKLRPEWREILVLRFFDDLAPRHVAARLQLPVNTVRSRTRRALQELRQRLGEDEQAFLGSWVAPFAGSILSPWSEPGTTPWLWKWFGNGALMMKPSALLIPACLLLLSLPWLLSDAAQGPDEQASVRVDAQDPIVSQRVERERATAAQEASVVPAELRAQATPQDPVTKSRADALPQDPWTLRVQLFQQFGVPLRKQLTIDLQLLAGYEGADVLASAQLKTNTEGQLEWVDSRPPGTLRVLLKHAGPGYLPASLTQLVTFDEPAPRELALNLQPLAARVFGRVLDEQGNPLAGVQMQAASGEAGQPTHDITEQNGSYSILVPDYAGNGFFRATHAGYGAEQIQLALGEGPGEYEHDVVLKRGYLLRGRVFDPYGNPLAGAELSESFDGARTVSGPDGRYELNTLDGSSSSWLLEARHPDWVRHRDHYTPHSPAATFDIHLGLGTTLSGQVVDQAGVGVAGAGVRIAVTMIHGDHFETISRDDGSFELHGAPLGAQTLWVHRDGYVTEERSMLLNEEGESGLRVQLRRGQQVNGRVRDEKGQPLAGLFVFASKSSWHKSARTTTDEQGRFRLSGLPEGDIQVSATAQGKLTAEQQVDSQSKDPVELTLRPAAGLMGLVLDDETGEVIEHFKVRLLGPKLKPREQAARVFDARWMRGKPFSSKRGRWSVEQEELAAGALLAVEVEAKGYAARVTPRAVATVNPEENLVVTRLTRGTGLSGTVVEGKTGEPISGATLQRFTLQHSLRWSGEEVRMPVTTDSSGRFHMPRVPPGEFSLAVSHPTWTSAVRRNLDMPANRPMNDVLVELFRGASIAGRQYRTDVGPEPDVSLILRAIQVEADPAAKHETRSDSDGHFRFDALAPGTYELLCQRQDGTFQLETERRHIQVQELEEFNLSTRSPGTACIDGRLRSASPIPAELVVRLQLSTPPKKASDPRGWSVLARDGRFEQCQLPAGQYEVTIDHRVPGSQELFTATASCEIRKGDIQVLWVELIPGKSTR